MTESNPVEQMERLVDRDLLAGHVDRLRNGVRDDESGEWLEIPWGEAELVSAAIERLVERDEKRP